MTYTRLLRHGMTGADVRHMKDALVSLGCLHRSTHNTFGDDTLRAVREYQRTHLDADGQPLAVDGIIGPRTWAAIERDLAMLTSGDAQPGAGVQDAPATAVIPDHIGAAAASAIAHDLQGVSGTRRDLVLEALRWTYDPAQPAAYPRSLYIRGGNLYNTDLKPNYITAARIESGAKRQPQYYTEPAKTIMLEAVAAEPETTGADCSGGVVGLCRHARVVSAGFDATANSLCSDRHSSAVSRGELLPGDWVGREGHIGVYVGGGYVVEWAGHRYGCQLTRLDRRGVWDFAAKRMRTLGAWSKYRRPKYI